MSKKKSKFLFLVLASLLVVALLTACSAPEVGPPPAEEEAAPPVAEEETTTEEEATSEEPGISEMDFVVWSYGLETVQDNIANFEAANPDVDITLQDHSWLEYHDIMVGRFVAGNPPPLLYGSDHWLQEWAAAGWLEPLDTYFPQVLDYDSELAPYARQGMTYDGHVYGLSYYADTMDFVYNADHLAAAGFDAAPDTWQDVWDMSVALKEQGVVKYPVVLAFSQQEGASIEAFISMVYGRYVGSGALFDDANAPTFASEGSAAFEAIEWMRLAYEAGLLDPASLSTAEIDQVKSMQAGAHTFTILP
ncbi:MAG: extracellular solute-binding protein, partial [Anaerolineales bacterium]|nr:extracellular solute-binding protein [Anaerolineales bacterium]